MKKIIFTLLALMVLIPGAIVYASSYTGPGNRTGISADVIVRTQCLSTEYEGNNPVWRYRDWDGVYAAPGSATALHWQASYPYAPEHTHCHSGLNGQFGWGEKTVNTGSYDPVSTSRSVTCGVPGNAGWCRGGLTLTMSATEPIPGYKVIRFDDDNGQLCNPTNALSITCTVSVTEQGAHSSDFWALSTFGDTSYKRSYSWRLDSVAPSLASTESGALFGDWYISDVSMSLSGADATSGIDPATYRWQAGGSWVSGSNYIFTADGVHNITAEVGDVAGNTATRNITIRLDKTPPSANPTITGTPQNGWYRSVSISANASDATSGLASIECRLNGGAWNNCTIDGGIQHIVLDGIHSVDFRVTDHAGHTTITPGITVSRDNAAPTLSPTLFPDGQNDWYVSNPVIPLVANDALSSVAPGSLRYRVNGLAWETGSNVTITEEGTHIIQAQVDDLAGNTGSVTFDVRVDTTSPDLAIDVSSAVPVQNSWHVEPATAEAVVSDATSGVGLVEYRVESAVASVGRAGRFSLVPQSAWVTGNNLMLAEGDHLVTMRATDSAGNQTVTSERVRVDLTAPISTFDAVSGPISGAVSLAGTSFDALSGVDVVEYSFDDGHTWEPIPHTDGDWAVPFDTTANPDGEYTVLLRAIDLAGHTEPTPTSLTVIVNNKPPKALMTESWWIWESGKLAVEPGITPLGQIRLQIACGSQLDVNMTFNDLKKLPSEFTWNRRCGDGHLAPPGDYQVILTACNIYGKCDTALGTIRIPEGEVPDEPELEPTEEVEPELAPTSAPSIPSTPTPTVEMDIVIIEAIPNVIARLSLWLLPLAGLVGSLAALGINHLRDPRPAAIRKLGSLLARRKDE